MKFAAIIIFFLSLSFQMNAQIDSRQKSVPIPAEEKEEAEPEATPTPILIKPEEKPSLTKPKDNYSGIPIKNKVTLKPSEKEFSMVEDNKLMNPGKIFEEKWADQKRKQQLEVYENIPPELLGDQFLGDFRLQSEYVTIICRDFGEQDGDLIKVLVNDKVVIARLALTHGYKTFNIPLEPGINKLDFFALNQGSLGFNTAYFQLADDKEKTISSNEWFLATGKKATLIMIKE